MNSIDEIRRIVAAIAHEYDIKRIDLFGSRAANTNRQDSDVDLIVEFNNPVSLLVLSDMKIKLEEALGLNVDLIHGPIKSTDMLELGKVVELYAA